MDGRFLYKSLGSFWTSLFQEKDTLKGYTLGLAEEVIQRYFDFVEVVNSFSPKEIDIFHREKWKPLIIRKSKYNQEPFVFEENDATFGEQPSTSEFYNNQVFQFGEPKRPISKVYVFDVGKSVASFGIIADRIISPTVLLHNGSDVVLRDTSLFFNTDLFANPNIPQLELIGENGQPETFVNNLGVAENDVLIVLWVYNAEADEDALYNSFGRIFNIQQDSGVFYKKLLQSIFNMYIDGPTVGAIKACCAAFLQMPIVINSSEIVEQVFTDTQGTQVVVTDKEAYRIDAAYSLRQEVVVGATLKAGDLLCDNIEFYDNSHQGTQTFYGNGSFSSGWWNKAGVLSSKLTLSKYLFSGKYFHQLAFSTEFDLVTLNEAGDIVFPVEGDPRDIATFHTYLNNADNKATLKTIFGLTAPGDVYSTIPVTFIMENFLKHNTSMLKFSFLSGKQRFNFLNLLPTIRQYTPPYIYLIIKIDLALEHEVYSNLNGATLLEFQEPSEPVYSLLLNADGSNASGTIEKLAPSFYIDVEARLFELSRGVKKDPDTALPGDYVIVSPITPDDTAVAEGRIMTVKEGQLLRAIPEGVTTQQYNNLLLLDFSA